MSKRVEVSILEIINYVGDRHRPLIEGEAVFRAGHIILCGLENIGGKVKSLCLQTSSLKSQPHEIEIEFTSPKWTCRCSCKAGNSGFCKHIFGTLIYINRHEDLEIISSTDVTQAWGKQKQEILNKYCDTEVESFCHKPKRFKATAIKTTPQIEFDIFNDGVAAHTTSALGSFILRDAREQQVPRKPMVVQQNSDFDAIIEAIKMSVVIDSISVDIAKLNPCCQDVIKSLEIHNDSDILKNCSQGSLEWHRERQLRVTGSRCYSIYTFSKHNEWDKKAKQFFWPTPFQSKYTSHGKMFENEALQTFKQNTGLKVVTLGFATCKKLPWLGYSPDGIIFNQGGPVRLLEIKCPFAGKDQPAEVFKNTCKYIIQTQDGRLCLKKRHQYYAQVQLGMFLLNLPSTDFILYSPFSKSYIHIAVEFDQQFAKDLVQITTEKYLKNMLHIYCNNK